MKTIVWFSQHPLLPAQEEELLRIFGEGSKIIHYPSPFDSAASVVANYKIMKGDEMAIVAPLSVVQRLCEMGMRPIRPVMDCIAYSKGGTIQKDRDVVIKGRLYRHRGWERVVGIKIITEEVKG